MKKIFLVLFVSILLFSGCRNTADKGQEAGIADSVMKVTPNNDHMIMSVLYFQKAAETRALFYQAFNMAKLMLDNDQKGKTRGEKAVVLDIDETVLDNSPYEAQCVLGKFGYPDKWEEWCNLSQAEPVPGVVDFLKYAVKKGYDIFYITNRKEILKEATLKNLIGKDLPMADEAHVLFRTEGNSKEGRRQQVLKTHQITLLIGDNLADFTSAFDNASDPERRAAITDSLIAEFGNRFIILPNAMYGDWEMALYPDAKAESPVKDSIRRANLKGF